MNPAKALRRPFGKTGLEVSPASIGGMRLPKDPDEAARVVRRAIELGANYIDTSRGYGDSELKLAGALKDGYRERVLLSTKWSPWIMPCDGPAGLTLAEQTRRRMEESFRRLDAKSLDFYQVWNINSLDAWRQASAPAGMLDAIREAIAQGRVARTAFTSHAKPAEMVEVARSGAFGTITVSYNLLAPGLAETIGTLAGLGLGVVIMNPLGGGALAERSDAIMKLLGPDEARTPVEAAMQFVLSTPGVSTAISGFSRLSDVEEVMAASARPPLPEARFRELLGGARALLPDKRGHCTGCGYCKKDCPEKVAIPAVLRSVYFADVLGMPAKARETWAQIGKGQEKYPDACADCGKCEDACTQKLPVREMIREAAKRFGEK